MISLENRIKGKTVLITGASSGIGLSCAKLFAKYGANLILAARRFDRLEAIKDDLENNYQANTFIYELDVTKADDVAKFLESIPDNFKEINILINNAGLALGLDDLINDDVTNWERMIDTNVKGFLTVLRLVSKQMVERSVEGHIINIGSIAGLESYAKGAVYCATKHAVHAITQAFREEMIEHCIKVSEVCPGAVNTEFSLVRFNGDRNRADSVYNGFEELSPDDIAEIIVYQANLPAHINIAESVIFPRAQARATKIHRRV